MDKHKLASRLALEISSWSIPALLEYSLHSLRQEGYSGIEVAEWSSEDLLSYCYDRYADHLLLMETEDLHDLAFRLIREGKLNINVLNGGPENEH